MIKNTKDNSLQKYVSNVFVKLFDLTKNNKLIDELKFENFNYILEDKEIKLKKDVFFYSLSDKKEKQIFINCLTGQEENFHDIKMFKLEIEYPENTVLIEEFWDKIETIFRYYVLNNKNSFFENDEEFKNFVFSREFIWNPTSKSEEFDFDDDDFFYSYRKPAKLHKDYIMNYKYLEPLNKIDLLVDKIMKDKKDKAYENYVYYDNDYSSLLSLSKNIKNVKNFKASASKMIIKELMDKKEKILTHVLLEEAEKLSYQVLVDQARDLLKMNFETKKVVLEYKDAILNQLKNNYQTKVEISTNLTEKISVFEFLSKVLPNMFDFIRICDSEDYLTWINSNKNIILENEVKLSSFNVKQYLDHELKELLAKMNPKTSRINNIYSYIEKINDEEFYENELKDIETSLSFLKK